MKTLKACLVLLAALSLILFLSPSVLGMWAAISDVGMAYQADLVVVAKASEKKDRGGKYATLKLTIGAVLKGNKDLKTVTLKTTSLKGGPVSSASFSFSNHDQGVWFLRKEVVDGKEMYVAFHPSCLVRIAKLDAAAKKKRIASLKQAIADARPQVATLAEAVKHANTDKAKEKVFRVQAKFSKEKLTRKTGGGKSYTYEQWFLTDGKALKVNTHPGGANKAATESLKAGKIVAVDITVKAYPQKGKPGKVVHAQILKVKPVGAVQ